MQSMSLCVVAAKTITGKKYEVRKKKETTNEQCSNTISEQRSRYGGC